MQRRVLTSIILLAVVLPAGGVEARGGGGGGHSAATPGAMHPSMPPSMLPSMLPSPSVSGLPHMQSPTLTRRPISPDRPALAVRIEDVPASGARSTHQSAGRATMPTSASSASSRATARSTPSRNAASTSTPTSVTRPLSPTGRTRSGVAAGSVAAPAADVSDQPTVTFAPVEPIYPSLAPEVPLIEQQPASASTTSGIDSAASSYSSQTPATTYSSSGATYAACTARWTLASGETEAQWDQNCLKTTPSSTTSSPNGISTSGTASDTAPNSAAPTNASP
jgi:hypothetical protein